MSKGQQYSITPLEFELKSLTSKDRKDQLVQYNLDKNLRFLRFRFTGPEPKTSTDFDQLLNEVLINNTVCELSKMTALSPGSVSFDTTAVKLTVTSMAFFDKLETSDIVGVGGQIKGCFDETFEGITVGDKLREMLLNECSENVDLFTSDERSELIFQLFKVLCVGGALCQPDGDVNRYLEMTKDIYKELVTIYRDSKTDTVQFSGKVFKVNGANGMEVFPDNPHSPLNSLIVILDALKKTVTIVKNDFKPFW